MRLKRRDFLILLGGLGGLGLAGLSKIWRDQRSGPLPTASLTSSTSSSPVTAAAGTAPLLRFVAIADAGAGDRNQFAVAAAMKHYYDHTPYPLVVMAGDNIYNSGEIERVGVAFEQPYQPLLKQGVKFRACLGNHDIRTQKGDPQVQYAGFNMQGRFYTFREQSVQFFVLETNPGADWATQLAWLKQELSRSDAPWKVVFGHHPVYSSGQYGTNSEMVRTLTPLFKQYGVQLYINGHEHSYERTRPIDGTTYVITGNGGAYLRPVSRSQWTEYSVSRYGFTAIEVYGDRLEIKAIGTDNQIFDRGSIPLHAV